MVNVIKYIVLTNLSLITYLTAPSKNDYIELPLHIQNISVFK